MTEKLNILTTFRAWKTENAVQDHNPLLRELIVPTKTITYDPGTTDVMTSHATGDMVGVHQFKKVKNVDEQHFVKIFKECLSQYYGLSKTAMQAFGVILEAYEEQPMRKGLNDMIELYQIGNTINGKELPFTYRTWIKGLQELIEKRFLWPRSSETYWTNPQLYYKGNRIDITTQYNLIETPNNRKITTTIVELPQPDNGK